MNTATRFPAVAGVPTEKTRALPEVIAQQDKLLGELNAAITALEHRLEPITDCPPPDAATDDVKAPAPTHLVHEINFHNRAIEQATQRVASLSERLHI